MTAKTSDIFLSLYLVASASSELASLCRPQFANLTPAGVWNRADTLSARSAPRHGRIEYAKLSYVTVPPDVFFWVLWQLRANCCIWSDIGRILNRLAGLVEGYRSIFAALQLGISKNTM